jgi:hypothetical protein
MQDQLASRKAVSKRTPYCLRLLGAFERYADDAICHCKSAARLHPHNQEFGRLRWPFA